MAVLARGLVYRPHPAMDVAVWVAGPRPGSPPPPWTWPFDLEV